MRLVKCDLSQTLKENLQGREIAEFPRFFVIRRSYRLRVLKDAGIIDKDIDNFDCDNDSDSDTNSVSDSESSDGDEIEEDSDSEDEGMLESKKQDFDVESKKQDFDLSGENDVDMVGN